MEHFEAAFSFEDETSVAASRTNSSRWLWFIRVLSEDEASDKELRQIIAQLEELGMTGNAMPVSSSRHQADRHHPFVSWP
ncbi:MAG: hypothetical protein CMQ29_06805 [Gammaproteobacteria bacterium]|nr:hypothetical protein [Gammaproteobacteria bacterium]